jgi:eukaryotic-like serine/threonine-protein kinase
MNTAEKVADSLPEGDSDPLLGMVINQKFKITQAIAVGGMGTIYRGEQLVLARSVAIKVLNPAYTANLRDPAFQKRFFLEASILSRLQHPNIVTVFDYGRIDTLEHDRFFMAMEFLPGETLHRRLRTRGWLTPPEALGIARQLARGLREAHKHGVVHRDMKPSNVMLVPDEDGVEIVKILDFGLGKVLSDDSEELTQQGSFLGSPRYMSPEQIAHGKVDHRTDVYSLGVMLYQMLCGKVPFESDKSVQILIAHLQTPVPPMKQRNPDVDVPEPIENFVRRCLEKNPDARPATMDDFIRQLRECASTMGLTAGFGASTSATLDAAPLAMHGAHPSGEHHHGPRHPPAAILPAEDVEVMLSSGSHAEIIVSSDGSIHSRESPSAVAPHRIAPAFVGAPAPANVARRVSELQNPSNFGFLVGGIGLVFILAAFLVLVLKQQPTQTSVQTVQPAAQTMQQNSFTLMLESYPAGAEVMENNERLGTTPMQLSLENDRVRAQPRRIMLVHPGYLPYSILQGPSDGNVHYMATLSVASVAPQQPPQGPAPVQVPAQQFPPAVEPTPEVRQVRVTRRPSVVRTPVQQSQPPSTPQTTQSHPSSGGNGVGDIVIER